MIEKLKELLSYTIVNDINYFRKEKARANLAMLLLPDLLDIIEAAEKAKGLMNSCYYSDAMEDATDALNYHFDELEIKIKDL